ncbi:hypothetical protein ILUMI_10146 [Ignelater luminosus]|uniref:PiggyBac transposable element-derived protein domain-containing protein n=1 Tax=Ignelater luminosus TaxID=2038154 RepID=A0A8K0D3T9_IGNLU|nr:hypothetical protein ILUMI_10146 [Ignelater luminosus]
MRLEIFEKESKKKRISTDYHEIVIVLRVLLMMSYNWVPAFDHYWSKNESLGNRTTKKAISRDRCKRLSAKMYFNSLEKVANCRKQFYIEEVVNCLKLTFQKFRSEAAFQSIDESVAKFKERSLMKQYLPLKPIKRGIKIWVGSDSPTGYVYDLKIYAGKKTETTSGALGERLVKNLARSLREKAVAVCFDRFFASAKLLNELDYTAVRTLIKSRRSVQEFFEKLNREHSQFRVNNEDTIVCRWQNTKDVLVISNCFSDGTRKDVPCPAMFQFYNANMGGVDLTDQIVGLYNFDRKSGKW